MGNCLEVKNISKAFVGVQALDNISFRADGGEVCALLGENGAGKSTLLKILSGAQTADSGEYYINGEKMEFKTPIEAIKAGVNIIYQERQLVGELTVAENIFMEDMYHNSFGVIDFKRSNEEAQRLIDVFHLPFKAGTKVKNLSVAHQQMVEIMKAYRRESKIIAFDEPTAPLSDAEINILFDLIKKLKEEGKVILYVSHRLGELFRITDSIVILKDGCFVDKIATKEATENQLVSKMVGRNIGDAYSMLDRNDKFGDVVLEVRNLEGSMVHNVSFGSNNAYMPGPLVICLTPDHGIMLKKSGYTKEMIQEHIHQYVYHEVPMVRNRGLVPVRPKEWENRHPLPVTRTPKDVEVVVVGGRGGHSGVILPWALHSEGCVEPIALPDGKIAKSIKEFKK